MSDLVKSLRDMGGGEHAVTICHEAADHIEALEALIKELKHQRKMTGKQAVANGLDLVRCRAYAQKLREALENIRDAANSFRDEEGYEVAGQVRIRVDAALALTPTSALAAVRDEVREECAVLVEDGGDCSYECNEIMAAAIRARKETGA